MPFFADRPDFQELLNRSNLQEIEVTLPIKTSQERRYILAPASFFINRFWGRRLNGVTINETLQIVHILEFKRSTDMDAGVPRGERSRGKQAAQEHHLCAQSSCSIV